MYSHSLGEFVGGVFAIVFMLVIYGIGLWVIYKFYKALARVGEELSEIKQALRTVPPRS